MGLYPPRALHNDQLQVKTFHTSPRHKLPPGPSTAGEPLSVGAWSPSHGKIKCFLKTQGNAAT